jgi:hypothetical protein
MCVCVCMYVRTYVCMCFTPCSQFSIKVAQLTKLFPLPHSHILCQLYQIQIVSPHFFWSTLMLSYHLNIHFPDVPFVAEFTNKIFYACSSHNFRSVSVSHSVRNKTQTVHCEWRSVSGLWRMVCAVAGTEVTSFQFDNSQLLTDTTVSDSPVLSYSQLLCKIPFGGRTGSEMNVISIATRTAVRLSLFVQYHCQARPSHKLGPFKQRELRQQE